MIIKNRVVSETVECLDIYAEFVSDILHMDVPEVLIDEEGLLDEDVIMRRMVVEGKTICILIRDTADIHDAASAVYIYYMLSVVLYNYCEELDGCNFASSIAANYKDAVADTMNEDEWSELNANAFAYLCAKDFFGATVSIGEWADAIADRADVIRDEFNEYVHDAYFKSFSDIIERISR